MGLPEPIRLVVQAHGPGASIGKRREPQQRESDDNTTATPGKRKPELLPSSYFQAQMKCHLLQAAFQEPPGGYGRPPGCLRVLYLPLYHREQEAFCLPLSSRG